MVHWRRGEGQAWERERLEGLGAALGLPDLGVALPLAEIYEGASFPAPPWSTLAIVLPPPDESGVNMHHHTAGLNT